MAAVYIHIPFCKSRCKYCDFYSTTLLGRRAEYIEALLAEIAMRTDEIGENIPTIYFGGGTPSLLEVADIQRILSTLLPSTQSDTAMDREITLEANPGDLTIDKLQALRRLGINRLSIGIQSLDDNLLHMIGRRHTAAEAITAVNWAREAGFDNISVDLMYGLPGQTIEQWIHDIDTVLTLRPEHISCYCLSYEDGTPLTRMLSRGEISEVDEETENAMYDTLCDKLQQAGYFRYEVSNFALPGRQSRHNSSYWNHTPYVGLGAGAHSYSQDVRSWNISDIEAYIQASLARSLLRESEKLDEEALHTEQVMLGLRTALGIDPDLVADRQPELNRYIAQGLLTFQQHPSGQRICTTQEGLHILNRIIQDLI